VKGLVDGPRSCRPDELAGVIALVDAAMREGSDQSLLTDYPLVYAPENLPNVQVVTVDGRVVATAPVLPRTIRLVAGGGEHTLRIGIISPTATDPPFQHRGYGSACVAACIARVDAAGIELSVLWTQVATFPFYESQQLPGRPRRPRGARAWPGRGGPFSRLRRDRP